MNSARDLRGLPEISIDQIDSALPQMPALYREVSTTAPLPVRSRV